jgi:hypothetical protein
MVFMGATINPASINLLLQIRIRGVKTVSNFVGSWPGGIRANGQRIWLPPDMFASLALIGARDGVAVAAEI